MVVDHWQRKTKINFMFWLYIQQNCNKNKYCKINARESYVKVRKRQIRFLAQSTNDYKQFNECLHNQKILRNNP